MAGSGGHGSGEIKYSDYLEAMHQGLMGYGSGDSLDSNMIELVNAAVVSNPWTSVDAFDPNGAFTFTAGSPLSNQQAVVTAMATISSGLTRALSETTDFNTILANAETQTDSVYDDAVDNEIDNIEDGSLAYSNTVLTALRSAARTEATAIGTAAETAANARLSGVISEAVAAAESAVTDNLQDVVDAYEEEIKPAYMRSVNRFTGMMADIGAVQSSAFVQGMANLEASFMRDVNRFSAEKRNELTSKAIEQYLSLYKGFIDTYFASADAQTKAQLEAYQISYRNFLQAYLENAKSRDSFRVQAIREMTGLLTTLVQTKQASVGNYLQLYQQLIVAMKEKVDKQAEFDGLETRWPLEATMYFGNAIGAIAGTGYMVDKPTTAGQSALSGALAGASIGMKAGAPGAIIGSIAGGLGGYFA